MPLLSSPLLPTCFGRSRRLCALIAFCAALLCGAATFACAEPGPSQKPAPDVIVFTNGDQLTGKFVRSTAGTVTFHSDIAGDIDIGWDKVRELRSSTTFAVFEKGQPPTKTPESKVPQGTITVQNDQLEVRQATGQIKEIAVKNADFVIDEATFENEIRHEPNLIHGWIGSATAGASLVEATQNTTTFSGSVGLVRSIPAVNWLLPRNRTTIDFNGSYGKITQPQAKGAPPLPDLKTALYHAAAERDQYFSPRFYVLAQTAFDHNFSQGLNLQEIFGGGVGMTVIKKPKQTLDLKATVQYERQQFLDSTSGTTQDLIGSTFQVSYLLKLPRSIVFTQQASFIPAYNTPHDYSANDTSSLAFPLYKRFSFSVSTLDSYLNDPPVAVYPSAPNKRNSFEFTTGVSYSLGQH